MASNRHPGEKRAGVVEPGNGWLAQRLGAIRGTLWRLPGRIVSTIHPDGGVGRALHLLEFGEPWSR